MVGGELKSYTTLLSEAREESLSRMIQQASQLGANAIINVRFATSAITAGAAEVYAYGKRKLWSAIASSAFWVVE